MGGARLRRDRLGRCRSRGRAGGELCPQRVQPVREVRTVDPEGIDERERGYAVDFGQNITGWVELAIEVTVPWNAATTVRLPAPDGATRASAGGDPIWSANAGVADALPEGVWSVERVEGAVRVNIGAGDHAFDVTIDR